MLDWVPTGGWGANGRGSEGGGGEEGAVDSGGGGVDGVTGDFVEGVEDFAREKKELGQHKFQDTFHQDTLWPCFWCTDYYPYYMPPACSKV